MLRRHIIIITITCAITGQSYTSPSHAAKGVGVSLPTALKSINTGAAIKHKPLGVYTWLVSPTTPPLKPPKDNRQQPVICVTTNTTYSTMSEAADAHGIDLTALSRAIRMDRPLISRTTNSKVKFIRQ